MVSCEILVLAFWGALKPRNVLLVGRTSPFLQSAVKNATNKYKACYLTCPLNFSHLTFSHNFHSWQLSSDMLQNRSKCLANVHVVLGNKPCDLDSLISTLAYAYFLDKVMEKLD